jgi:hypothetical protein
MFCADDATGTVALPGTAGEYMDSPLRQHGPFRRGASMYAPAVAVNAVAVDAVAVDAVAVDAVAVTADCRLPYAIPTPAYR